MFVAVGIESVARPFKTCPSECEAGVNPVPFVVDLHDSGLLIM